MKKQILSILLLFCFINYVSLPVFANDYSKLAAEFATELNVNKASKGEIVQFRTTEEYKDNNGVVIPAGTVFEGKVHDFKKGRWGYRRAKAHIVIDKMILPTGEIYDVSGKTDKSVLKGSAVANVSKGVITLPVALVVGAAGVCVVIVETVTIVGILLVGPTLFIVGETTGKLTHGVNCVKHQGNSVKLKIKKLNVVPVQSDTNSD